MGLPFWGDREKDAGISVREHNASQESTIQDGSVKYTAAEGINSTSVTYQDASGAPVETDSPLGYSVSFWTSLCLNINQMVGTGIFSTREYVPITPFQPSYLCLRSCHHS